MAPKGKGEGNGKRKPAGSLSPLKEKKQKNVQESSSKSNVLRLWKEKDETILLEALLEQFMRQNQQLPDPDNDVSFLSTLKEPLSFQPDPFQLRNKLRVFRQIYRKHKRNPHSVKEGHPRFVYEMCHKLFGSGDDGIADEEDDGGRYPYLLQMMEQAAAQFMRLLEIEDEDLVSLLGPSTARKFEEDLKEVNHSMTKLKMKELKLFDKIITIIFQ